MAHVEAIETDQQANALNIDIHRMRPMLTTLTGHESAAVHSGYTHHERETLARAVEKMPGV